MPIPKLFLKKYKKSSFYINFLSIPIPGIFTLLQVFDFWLNHDVNKTNPNLACQRRHEPLQVVYILRQRQLSHAHLVPKRNESSLAFSKRCLLKTLLFVFFSEESLQKAVSSSSSTHVWKVWKYNEITSTAISKELGNFSSIHRLNRLFLLKSPF